MTDGQYAKYARPLRLVLALTDNGKFHDGEFTPTPAPSTFRF